MMTAFFQGSAQGGDAPISYQWDCGDGTGGSSAQNPSHAYTTAGSYTARLVVTDADGDSDTASIAIEVASDDQPTITASATPLSGLAPIFLCMRSTIASLTLTVGYIVFLMDQVSTRDRTQRFSSGDMIFSQGMVPACL